MRDLRDFPVEAWDRLFGLLEDTTNWSDEEVDAALKQAGIDMAPAHARLRAMVQGGKEKLCTGDHI